MKKNAIALRLHLHLTFGTDFRDWDVSSVNALQT